MYKTPKMNHLACFVILFLIFASNIVKAQSTFKTQQLRHSKVKEAYDEYYHQIKDEIKEKHRIDITRMHIFLRAFKRDEVFEIWIKDKDSGSYVLYKDFLICAQSGRLGPKRVLGDGQIPEGVYELTHFNPYSNYFLSIKVEYPNRADRVFADKVRPGGNIYIHGACGSIGCLSITDEKIKPLYVLAVEAKNNGQKTLPIHIFPTRMDDDNFILLKQHYGEIKDLTDFWSNLRPVYTYFEKNRTLPKIRITADGKYTIQ